MPDLWQRERLGTVHEEGHFGEGGNHGKDLYDSLYEGWVCQDSYYIQFGLFLTETSLQKLGKKILAVDFDSQANLTTCFGVEQFR